MSAAQAGIGSGPPDSSPMSWSLTRCAGPWNSASSVPDDRLPTERELSDMLDVFLAPPSRTAVGFLERGGADRGARRGRGGGFTVQAPGVRPGRDAPGDAPQQTRGRDAFDYRIIVETGATRLAAERRRAIDLTGLHKLLNGMDTALQTAMEDQSAQHTTDFQTLDSAFHLGIAQAAQNDRLLDAVADARRRMWLPVGAIFGRLEPNANDYHESILEAIENRDRVGRRADGGPHQRHPAIRN